jgi:hypothetical protein
MGKREDREYSEMQRIKHENQKLKKENSRLRKQLSRMDVERFEELQELVEQSALEDKQIRKDQKDIKEEWGCWTCKTGHLRLIIVNRRDGVFYYRGCDNCDKRTRLKKYSSNVKGVPAEEPTE